MYLGYCIIRDGNSIEYKIDVWATQEEAERSLIAWFFGECPPSKYETDKNLKCLISYTDPKTESFSEYLFNQCTDIELIKSVWEYINESNILDSEETIFGTRKINI